MIDVLVAVFANKDVNHTRLECTQEIIPVVIRHDKQSVLELPLDGVHLAASTRWMMGGPVTSWKRIPAGSS